MLLFMLSLGGIPPTAGFMGKFWLFGAAIDSHYYWLAVIGVLNSAISLYYYVRIVVFMYLKKDTIGSEPVTSPALAAGAGGGGGWRRSSSASIRGCCSSWPTRPRARLAWPEFPPPSASTKGEPANSRVGSWTSGILRPPGSALVKFFTRYDIVEGRRAHHVC